MATDTKPVAPVKLAQLDDTPIEYRIPDILTDQGNVLISAYRKAGKTSLILDLIKSLTTGADFLGGLSCDPLDGPVVYVNLELFQSMLRKYALDIGIKLSNDSFLIQDYRGRASKFLLADDEWRDDYAYELRAIQASALIIDPISPLLAMNGVDSNDNDMSRVVLEQLGEVATLAGMKHLFVVDHTGHVEKNRSRGASAKEDWADMLWNIKHDPGQPEGSPYRILDVIGRGVQGSQRYAMQDKKLRLATPDTAPKNGQSKPTKEGEILSELRKGARTISELAGLAKVNLSEERVRQILSDLETRGSVLKQGKRQQADLWIVPKRQAGKRF